MNTPRAFLRSESHADDAFSERRWAKFGIALSCSVILAKLIHSYGDSLQDMLVESKLTQVQQLAEDGQLMYRHAYENTVRYSSIWLPLVCGLLATYITWITVYLDSDVPGVHPPTPLSPKKLRKASGHVFHMSYVFALMVGGMVTYYMYSSGMHIHYAA